jgi:hypothetical protein
MPAVSAVSVSQAPPIVGSRFVERVRLPGDQPQTITVVSNGVTADYFRVLGVRLLRGRGFSEDEAFARPDGTCGPVIVSESLALRLFGTGDALNRVLVIPRTRPPMECEVVGVAADVRMKGPGTDWEPILYRLLARSSSAAAGSKRL